MVAVCVMGTLLPSVAKQRSRADPTCALALTLFGARALCFAKACFFACQLHQRAPRANTRANDTRVRLADWLYWWAPLLNQKMARLLFVMT